MVTKKPDVVVAAKTLRQALAEYDAVLSAVAPLSVALPDGPGNADFRRLNRATNALATAARSALAAEPSEAEHDRLAAFFQDYTKCAPLSAGEFADEFYASPLDPAAEEPNERVLGIPVKLDPTMRLDEVRLAQTDAEGKVTDVGRIVDIAEPTAASEVPRSRWSDENASSPARRIGDVPAPAPDALGAMEQRAILAETRLVSALSFVPATVTCGELREAAERYARAPRPDRERLVRTLREYGFDAGRAAVLADFILARGKR